MSAFLYFITGLDKPVELADLAELGLAYAFEQTPQCSPISGRTPSGASGMLLWSQRRLGSLSPVYNPDVQAWRKVPGKEGLWVGFYTAWKPKPEVLRKTGGMAGETVVLGDGHEWIVPRLALWSGEAGFTPAYSMVADLDDAGNWISGGPAGESAGLKDLFDRLYPWLADPDGVASSDALDGASELLAINYAVSKIELACLKALKTDESLVRILRVALDWDAVIDWTKKKMMESSPVVSAG